MLSCPTCSAPLDTADTVSCSECDVHFASIEMDNAVSVPALFQNPEQAVANGYLGFHQSVRQLDQQISELSEGIKDSNRKQALLPILKALHDNREYFDTQRQQLDRQVESKVLLEQAEQRQNLNYGYSFEYLKRDWSSDKQSVASRDYLKGLAIAALGHCDASFVAKAHGLVLGAGLARLATELTANFSRVSAIESSLGQVMQFHQLVHEPQKFWQVNTLNTRTDQDILVKQTAEMPSELVEGAQSLNFLWADAAHLPLAKRSVDVIVSCYFSDVLPLSTLFREAKKVLSSGGYFIHIGPLHYHFSDISQHYSATAFVEQFANHGFEIIHQAEHQQEPIADQGGLLIPQQYRDLLIVARLNEAGDSEDGNH